MQRPRISSPSAVCLFGTVVFILQLIPSIPTYAQSSGDDAIDDSWALQFQVTENFTLGSFQGPLLSAKRQYDPRRAFRFGIGLRARINQQSRENDPSEIESDGSRQSLLVQAQWVRYPVAEGPVRAYWGIGPVVDFFRRVENESTTEVGDSRLMIEGGAIGLLGAEWFVRPQISLIAEYRAGLTYTWRQQKQTAGGTETNRLRTSELSLGSRGVLFGVSVYF